MENPIITGRSTRVVMVVVLSHDWRQSCRRFFFRRRRTALHCTVPRAHYTVTHALHTLNTHSCTHARTVAVLWPRFAQSCAIGPRACLAAMGSRDWVNNVCVCVCGATGIMALPAGLDRILLTAMCSCVLIRGAASVGSSGWTSRSDRRYCGCHTE